MQPQSKAPMRILPHRLVIGGELSFHMGYLSPLIPLNVVDFREVQTVYVYYKDTDDPEVQRLVNFLKNMVKEYLSGRDVAEKV